MLNRVALPERSHVQCLTLDGLSPSLTFLPVAAKTMFLIVVTGGGELIYNRDRLAEYGLNLRSVAELVRNKVQGRSAPQFRREDQRIDFVVRLRESDRLGIEELRRLIVNPSGAVPIPQPIARTAAVAASSGRLQRDVGWLTCFPSSSNAGSTSHA